MQDVLGAWETRIPCACGVCAVREQASAGCVQRPFCSSVHAPCTRTPGLCRHLEGVCSHVQRRVQTGTGTAGAGRVMDVPRDGEVVTRDGEEEVTGERERVKFFSGTCRACQRMQACNRAQVGYRDLYLRRDGHKCPCRIYPKAERQIRNPVQ